MTPSEDCMKRAREICAKEVFAHQNYGRIVNAIATALQEAEGKGLVRINEIYCDRETGEKLSFQRIIELEIALTAARERVRVLEEALKIMPCSCTDIEGVECDHYPENEECSRSIADKAITEGQKEEGKMSEPYTKCGCLVCTRCSGKPKPGNHLCASCLDFCK